LKLAAATADTVVHVFDETGKKRDKFKTKAADANSTAAYLVKGLAFSPDSTKLAVAQSDSSVFVYRCAHVRTVFGGRSLHHALLLLKQQQPVNVKRAQSFAMAVQAGA
jgi:WD40 repeat protein